MPNDFYQDEEGKVIITNPRIVNALDPISKRVLEGLQTLGEVIIMEAKP